MLELWRISNHNSLSGVGGLRYGARWHTSGSRIVYLAETPAGALIEIFVHLELKESDLPRCYSLEHFSYWCRALKGSLNQAFASSAVRSGSSSAMA